MAVFTSVLSPYSATGGIEDTQKASAVANTASSAEIVVGPRTLHAIIAVPTPGQSPNGYSNVRYGPAGLAAAAATDFALPDNMVIILDTGEEFNSIRFFNNSSVTGTRDYYVMRLSRAK